MACTTYLLAFLMITKLASPYDQGYRVRVAALLDRRDMIVERLTSLGQGLACGGDELRARLHVLVLSMH